MSINGKCVHIRNRGEFQRLMSYLARAIDTRRLHDPVKIPVIAITGHMGKSLAAEAMMKTWMDGRTKHDATDIPADKKMFLEEFPAAACRTVSTQADVAGKSSTLAFNSDELRLGFDLDHAVNEQFSHAATGGVMIVSNTQESAFRGNRQNVLLAIDIGHAEHGKDPFNRRIEIEVIDKDLLSDNRFATYWKHPLLYRRGYSYVEPEGMKPKVPPLPGIVKT